MSKTKKTAQSHLRLVPRLHPAPGRGPGLGIPSSPRRSGPPFQPRSKADWLLVNLFPDDPEFPLDPELEAQIPKDLPGEVPQNLTELYADVQVTTRSAKPSLPRGDVPYDVSTDE